MNAAATPLLKVAVLISGRGTTLKNLIEQVDAGELPVELALVISSRSDAAGLQLAQEAGIANRVIEQRRRSAEQYSSELFAECRAADVGLVVMAGFTKFVPIPSDFAHRVMNIHPSLIPAFCGQGYYGLRVHASVLEYGVKLSGCTVHFVDNVYDHGPIVLQRVVEVRDGDTPETLAQRVFAEECIAYPMAIRWFAENRLSVKGRWVHIANS